MNNFSPIVLFVYKRAWHTRQTINALLSNDLSAESELFIYSDAAKSDKDSSAVQEVRDYIKTIDGFKNVTVIEREKNWGLANSIIDGVTSIVTKYGKIIVLEDDLVSSPHFLTYMNDALDAYQDEEKVMHISGYMFPIDSSNMKETFFLRTASCWGWATWDKAWIHFAKDPSKLIGEYTEQKINRFNLDGTNNFWSQVEQNKSRLINTWAVFWYASIFQVDGLCLHPVYSMVNNIGNDDTGVHCKTTDVYVTTLATEPVKYFEKNIIESKMALSKTKNYFLSIRPTYLNRILSGIKRRLSF